MFDLRRFLRLASVQWAEHGRGYLWFLLIGIAVHACLWLAMTGGGAHAQSFQSSVQSAVYVCGLLVTAPLFAGRYFEVLGHRESALPCLMRPASSLEKFLLALLIVGLAFPLAYTLAFQVCNVPAALLADAARGSQAIAAHSRETDFSPYLPFTDPENDDWEWAMFLAVLSLQGLMVCSGLFFRRLALLKGYVSAFVLLLLLLLLAAVSDSSPERLFALWSGNYAVPGAFAAWLWIVWLGVPALLWASAACLLRERELQ